MMGELIESKELETAEKNSVASRIRSAKGKGHTIFMEKRRKFSFAVKVGKNGKVTGRAKTKNGATGSKRRISLNCLVPWSNSSALLGGIVSKSNNSNEIGERVVFAIEDNGHGKKDRPDRLTGLFFLPPMPSVPDCAQPPFEPPFMEVEQGEITVK